MGDRLSSEREADIRYDLAHHMCGDKSAMDLLAEIDALRADLTASQVQVAAAFQVSAKILEGMQCTCDSRDDHEMYCPISIKRRILALTPESALAALDTLLQAGIDAGIEYGETFERWEADNELPEPKKPTPESVRWSKL